MAECKGVSELKHADVPFSLHGFVSLRMKAICVCVHLQRAREVTGCPGAIGSTGGNHLTQMLRTQLQPSPRVSQSSQL